MGKRVLIIDDDESAREVYVAYFAAKGYSTIGAKNGEEGLQILGREKVDLVILDLAMPGVQGEDVMDSMAKNDEWKTIPILVDTALGKENNRSKKIRERFAGKLHFDIFTRPGSLDELEKRMADIIVL